MCWQRSSWVDKEDLWNLGFEIFFAFRIGWIMNVLQMHILQNTERNKLWTRRREEKWKVLKGSETEAMNFILGIKWIYNDCECFWSNLDEWKCRQYQYVCADKAVIRSTRIKLHFCSESKFSTYLSGSSHQLSSSVLAHKASGHRFESFWWSGAEMISFFLLFLWKNLQLHFGNVTTFWFYLQGMASLTSLLTLSWAP